MIIAVAKIRYAIYSNDNYWFKKRLVPVCKKQKIVY